MQSSLALGLAFGIGVVAGLRSMTAPAVTAWAGHLGWLRFYGTTLAFMGSPGGVGVLAVGALGELVADKLPMTPSRTKPGPLAARIVMGGLSGACVTAAGGSWPCVGGALGEKDGTEATFPG